MTGKPGKTTSTGTKAAETRAKEAEALRLRLMHFSLEEIARRLEYADASGAHKAITRALKRSVQEPADELRFMEAKRYDEILVGIWGEVLRGNLQAIDRAIKVMHQRAVLLGLNAPARINWTYIIDKVADEEGLSPEERKEFHRDLKGYLAEVSGAFDRS